MTASSTSVKARLARDWFLRRPTLILVGIWIVLGIARFLAALPIHQPQIMTDELRYWQMALSFWEKGAFLFHGKPFDIPSILYPILLSPLFAIPDLTLVFDLARLVNGFLLSAVLFPTYALAREFTDSRMALFPAVLAGLVPGAVYSSLIMAENLYYPLFCLSFWLAYRTLVRANWRDAALASLAFFATFFTKPNLVFLAVAYGAALTVSVAQQFRRRSLEPWTGFGLLPRLVPFAGLGAAAAVRLALRGGLHPGQSWKGIVGGEAYALVFDPGGGVPTPLRIAGLAVGLLLTLFLSVGFVPAGRFLGAATRFRALPDRLRTYLVFCFALGLVYLAAVIRISLLDLELRMHERYLFVLAPMLLVLLSVGGRSQLRISLVATAVLWLVWTFWLATRYRQVLTWNVQSDSPSLTAFFYVSRRYPGVVPLILSAVVVGALALASMLRRRVWTAFGSLGLLFVLLNAGWYANVYSLEELHFFKKFALNVGGRVRPGETIAIITDGLDPRVVWGLEFWLRNPVALLTVSEQKNEWWIHASGSYADLLRSAHPSLLVVAATTEKQLPRDLRLLGRAPDLPTPALLYASGPP